MSQQMPSPVVEAPRSGLQAGGSAVSLLGVSVEAELKGRPVYLIETLAENIAARLLNNFPILSGLTLEIEKPFAPVGTDLDGIAVVIRRTRA